MFTIADVFAGIGGFHLAADRLGATCVFACEVNAAARKTYAANFSVTDASFATDIVAVSKGAVPDFDVLCAGFPCQPFSIAGAREGFADPRGTMFFELAKLLEAKRPRAFFFENVRGLMSHDGGRTLATIKDTIEQLGYDMSVHVVNAAHYGVPQGRVRLFMIGFRDDTGAAERFVAPSPMPLPFVLADVVGGPLEPPRDIAYTIRCGGSGSKGTRHNWRDYDRADGTPVTLSVAQAARLQGFPESFLFPVSATAAMRQLGNAVAVPAVQAWMAAMFAAMA